MNTLRGADNNTFFKHALPMFGRSFNGFETTGWGHHPLQWDAHRILQRQRELQQLYACLEECCPGLVDLVEAPVRAHLDAAPIPAVARARLWKDLFAAALAITTAPRLYHTRVVRFYPNLTPEAIAPYERVFHARRRTDTDRDAARAADVVLGFGAGTLGMQHGDGNLDTVKRLSLQVDSDAIIFMVGGERAAFYTEKYIAAKWKQRVKSYPKKLVLEDHYLKEPVPLWQRLDTLRTQATRAVLKNWAQQSPAKRRAFNALLASWSTDAPPAKKQRQTYLSVYFPDTAKT